MSWEVPVATLGPACAFLSSLTWAVGSTGYSRLSRNYSAFAVNFARALMALPLFVLVAFASSGGVSQGLNAYAAMKVSHLGWFSLSMLASYGLGDVLFLWSTRELGVPAALAIASCYPLWNLVVGFLFHDEIPGTRQVLALVAIVAGIGFVILSNPSNAAVPRNPADLKSQSPRILKGFLLAFATSLSWWINGYAISRVGTDLTVAVGSTVRMVVALFLSLFLGKVFEPRSRLMLPARELQRCSWLFAVEAFGGTYLFMYGLSHSPLAVGSTLSALAPVISVPIAWLLGAEKFSLFRVFGVLIVVSGVALLLGGF